MQRNITSIATPRIALSLVVAGALMTAGCAKGDTSGSNVSSGSYNSDTQTTSSPGRSSSTGDSRAHSVAATTGDAEHGATIFRANCAACHGTNGGGGGIGPVLQGETKRKDFRAAVAWIKNPQPPMPKLYPTPLSAKDVNDVAAYVETL